MNPRPLRIVVQCRKCRSTLFAFAWTPEPTSQDPARLEIVSLKDALSVNRSRGDNSGMAGLATWTGNCACPEPEPEAQR